MSLINDALKRASEFDKNRPGPGPAARPLQPVETARGRQPAWMWLFTISALLLLSASFFWQWRRASHHVAAAPAVLKTPPAPMPATTPAAPPALTPASLPPKAPVVTAPVKPPPQLAPTPSAPAFATPWPASLTLQGIFYSNTHPLALINGKTVAQGDSITGVVVAKIEPRQVTLAWNGQSKTLVLNEH